MKASSADPHFVYLSVNPAALSSLAATTTWPVIESRAEGPRPDPKAASKGGAKGAAPGGHGIPGMRERASALGGEFEAGSGPEGGFRVSARLPVTPKGA